MLSCPLLEVVEWAKRTSRTNLPVETRCKHCAGVARSFPQLSWDGLVAKSKASPEFQLEVNKARQVLQKEKVPDFHSQTYNETSEMSVEMERHMLWVSLAEFEDAYKIKATLVPELRDLITEIQNENGKLERGFAVRDPAMPFRRLVLRNSLGTNLSTALLGQQIRAKQGSDLKEWFEEDLLRQRPKSLKASIVMADVEAWAKRARDGVVMEAVAEQPPAPPQAASTVKQEQTDENREPEEEEDEAVVDDSLQGPDVALPSTLAAGSKKRKGAGKGSSAKGAGTKERKKEKPPKLAAPVRTLVKTEDGEGERSRSPGSRGSTAGTKTKVTLDHLTVQAQKYHKWLDPADVLAGKSLGQPVFQAQRIHKALEAQYPGCAEGVMLKARLNLIATAERLAPTSILSLSKPVRRKLLQEFCPAINNFPPEFREALLIATVRDAGVPSQVSDAEKWVQQVSPFLREGCLLSPAQVGRCNH